MQESNKYYQYSDEQIIDAREEFDEQSIYSQMKPELSPVVDYPSDNQMSLDEAFHEELRKDFKEPKLKL